MRKELEKEFAMHKDILIMSACPPPAGGIATWTEDYLEFCCKYGLEYDLVDISMTGKRRTRVVNTNRSIFDEIIRTIRIMRSMKLFCRTNDYSIFHINSSCSKFGIIRDYLSIRVAKKKGIRVFFHCHCHVPTQMKSHIALLVFKRILRCADDVIVLNGQSMQFTNDLGIKKCRIIPNFIDSNDIIMRDCFSARIDELIYVGHIINQKGIDLLIDVASHCEDRRFVLVGPIDEEYQKIQFPENVVLTGVKNHQEISDLLAKADVFIFLSKSEGFSISLLEAMKSGLPVIATDVGANSDAIANDGGVIINNYDSNEVIEAIGALDDPEIRRRMSHYNSNRVINEYDKDKILHMLINAYGLSDELGEEKR